MKIDKLMTLSQFVDIIKESVATLKLNSTYELIFKYNDFLKQPLTKEMFVNEIKKPDRNDFDLQHKVGNDAYFSELKTWQEAEKKVIFENLAQSSINYDWDTIKIIYPTLQDLALTTNGKTELQNVSL